MRHHLRQVIIRNESDRDFKSKTNNLSRKLTAIIHPSKSSKIHRLRCDKKRQFLTSSMIHMQFLRGLLDKLRDFAQTSYIKSILEAFSGEAVHNFKFSKG